MIQNGIVGLNVNQNHRQGARISTRVLAPPGGGSSFSIGGGGFGGSMGMPAGQKSRPPAEPSSYSSYRSHSNEQDENRYQKHNQAPVPVPARAYRREAVDEARNYRDSLDDAVDYSYTNAAKERYASQSSNSQPVALSSRFGQNNGPISKRDYAEMLRMQIASNKGMDSGSKIGSMHQDRATNSDYQYNRQGRQASHAMSREHALPKAARTTFSLNWQ